MRRNRLMFDNKNNNTKRWSRRSFVNHLLTKPFQGKRCTRIKRSNRKPFKLIYNESRQFLNSL